MSGKRAQGWLRGQVARSQQEADICGCGGGPKGPEINLIEWLGPGANCRFVVRFSSFLVGIVATPLPYRGYEPAGKSPATRGPCLAVRSFLTNRNPLLMEYVADPRRGETQMNEIVIVAGSESRISKVTQFLWKQVANRLNHISAPSSFAKDIKAGPQDPVLDSTGRVLSGEALKNSHENRSSSARA
ncbi:hypothetical protein WN48_01467 [Eufriesea mexicana]|nr:hypothetical protein WN48_01467 [Eufriesea mexicana]